MSKRMPVEKEEDPEFQIASMVDILMTLLIFFVATATMEVTTQIANLELPEAPQAEDPDKREGQMVINIERMTQAITISTVIIPNVDDLVPMIEEARKNSQSQDRTFRVLIRADRNTPYSKVRDVMQACAKAGVLDVIFATTKGDE